MISLERGKFVKELNVIGFFIRFFIICIYILYRTVSIVEVMK